MNERPFFFQVILFNDYKFLKQCFESYQLPWHYLEKKMQRKRWNVREQLQLKYSSFEFCVITNIWMGLASRMTPQSVSGCMFQASLFASSWGWVLAPVMVYAVHTADLFACCLPASGQGRWHFLKQCRRAQACQKLSAVWSPTICPS